MAKAGHLTPELRPYDLDLDLVRDNHHVLADGLLCHIAVDPAEHQVIVVARQDIGEIAIEYGESEMYLAGIYIYR